MNKQSLSKEDLFNNFKKLVFEHNEKSGENLKSLFDLANFFNDIETIQKLANEYYFMDAIKYCEKIENKEDYPNLIEMIIKNIDYDSLKKVIDQGIYLNQRDNDGDTALVVAAKLNKIDIVKLLLKNNADVNVKLQNGNRLVDDILKFGYREILNLLIDYGADNILEEYASKFFYDVDKHISSQFVAKQFIYEELDAARFGNDDAVHFVNLSGVKEELYINAMKRSLPEVDGVGSPQQILRFNCILPITTKNNQELVTKISILTVEKVMSKYRIGKYKNKILKLTLDNTTVILIYNDYIMIEEERFEKITERKFYNESRQIYLELLNNAVKFSEKSYEVENIKEDYFSVANEEEILKFDAKHNPKRLVEILNYFTKDNPIKYTAHSFDWNKYSTYENFMNQVKKTFEAIDDDLKFLSPNLYEKITKFLFSDSLSENNTWGINRIGYGWSSQELKRWAHEEELKIDGKKAIYFPIPQDFCKQVNGKTISNFEDICNVFKNEIEIRDDGKLSMLLEELEEEVLGFDFEVTYDKNLSNVSFYTDVEYLRNAIVKIFEQFKVDSRKDYDNIFIEAISDENGKYIDLLITQIGSTMSKSPELLKDEINDGDFQDIRSSLLSICDWSILGVYKEENFKIDYLSVNTEKINLSSPKSVPNGFTHKLRFYNA